MLFILAMDPLQCLFDKATQQGLLCPIGADPIRMRTSLYADDAALFVRPKVDDLITVRQLLQTFGDATGLHTNLHKSEIYRISLMNWSWMVLQQTFLPTVLLFHAITLDCRYTLEGREE